tara:strand:- start:5235 stop:5504 length:270 start_codon:yes stop_codon:yes gene_type:complete
MRKNYWNTKLLVLLLALCQSWPVFAYVGPGLGAGVIGVIVGLLGSVVLAFLGLFWYPLKRKMRGKNEFSDEDSANEQESSLPEQDDKPQ